MLTWNKVSALGTDGHAGYSATGATGRFYAILKHGTRFRLSAGGGHSDQKIATLAALKTICEGIEVQLAEFADVLDINVPVPPVVADLLNGTLPGYDELTQHNAAVIAAATPGDDFDDDLGRVDIDWDSPGEPLPAVPAVPVPDPDLDPGHIVLPPGSAPIAPQPEPQPAPNWHPDNETPLEPKMPDESGNPVVLTRLFMEPLDVTFERLALRRDLTWRPGAVIAPVKRYAKLRGR